MKGTRHLKTERKSQHDLESFHVPGLLDGPNIPPHLKPDEVSYKIFLCGKAGVGKTALVSKLVGRGKEVDSCDTTLFAIKPVHSYHPNLET